LIAPPLRSMPGPGLLTRSRDTAWVDAVDADWIHFSGITLQLLTPTSLDAFIRRLQYLHSKGARVSFDTNYRPAGWSPASAAPPELGTEASLSPEPDHRTRPRSVFDQAARCSDIVFASLDDETVLRGAQTPERLIEHYQSLGAQEVVVKLGPDGAIVAQGLRRHPVTPHGGIDVVDTTAAGDALAGAYVAARLAGCVPADAADLGVAVASEVIRWPGAIVPRERFSVPLST
jgi:2-dehydro-3-deoxygluconokinase